MPMLSSDSTWYSCTVHLYSAVAKWYCIVQLYRLYYNVCYTRLQCAFTGCTVPVQCTQNTVYLYSVQCTCTGIVHCTVLAHCTAL